MERRRSSLEIFILCGNHVFYSHQSELHKWLLLGIKKFLSKKLALDEICPHISLFWNDWDTHQEHKHYPSLMKGGEASWEEVWICLFDLSLEHNFTLNVANNAWTKNDHLLGVPLSASESMTLILVGAIIMIFSHLVRWLVLHRNFTPWVCWKWERPCIGMTCWSIAIISVTMVPWHILALHVQPRLHCFVVALYGCLGCTPALEGLQNKRNWQE